MADYPGTDYTPVTQVNGPGYAEGGTDIAGAGFINGVTAEVEAVVADLNNAIDANPTGITTVAGAAASALPAYLATRGLRSISWDGANEEPWPVTGNSSQALGTDDALAEVTKPAADGSLTFDATAKTITQTGHTTTFETYLFAGSMYIQVDGSTLNDGTYLVDSVSGAVITLDAGETLVNEGPTAAVDVYAHAIALTTTRAAGVYEAHAQAFINASAAGVFTFRIRKNGSDLGFLLQDQITATGALNKVLTRTEPLTLTAVGDWVDVTIDSTTAITATSARGMLRLSRVGSVVA